MRILLALLLAVLGSQAFAVVSTPTDQIQYTGTGSVASYAIPFKFFQNTDLYVSENASGVITQELLGINYTLVGAGYPSGGTITLTAGNLASGVVLTVFRNPALVQNVSLPNGSPYFGSTIESALDLACMQIQAQANYISRSIQFPVGDTATAVLPSATIRANQYLAFDSSGNAIPIAANNASGTAVTATGSTTARLLADRFANVLNVKDYGALGNGTTDDTASIQSVLNLIDVNGGICYLPPGTYDVSSTLTLVGTTNGLIGGTIAGSGLGCTNIIPSSALAGKPVIEITDCRGTEIQDLYIHGTSSGSPALCGVEYFATGTAPGSTNNRIHRCWFGNASTGTMTYGIEWACAGGNGGSGDVDNDDSIIDSCRFANLVTAGAYITHSNSLWHRFIGCSFTTLPTGILAASGSFNAISCSFTCSAYDFQTATDATEPIYHPSMATNCESESNGSVSGYLLNVGAGVALSTGATFTFVNCDRQGSISGTGNLIQSDSSGGIVTCIGCQFVTGTVNKISMLAPGKLVLIGCSLGLGQVSYNGVWTSVGNYFLSGTPTDSDAGSSNVFQAGDINSSNPLIYGGLRGNLVAMSGGNTTGITHNLRGKLTFTGSSQAQTVTFPTTETDANYYITLSGGYISGTQVNSSLKTAWANKGASGFTAILPDGAPGTGNTVEVDWQISR